MWYTPIKRFYDNGHPSYTVDGIKAFVVAKMITAVQYKQITDVEYVA